jgi:hypothetical protein
VDKLERRRDLLQVELTGLDKRLAEAVAEEKELEGALSNMPAVDEVAYEEAVEKLKADRALLSAKTLAEKQMDRAEASLEGIEDKIWSDNRLDTAVERATEASAAATVLLVEAQKELDEADRLVAKLTDTVNSGVCGECGQTVGDAGALEKYKLELVEAEARRQVCLINQASCQEKVTNARARMKEAGKQREAGHGGWENKKAVLQASFEDSSKEFFSSAAPTNVAIERDQTLLEGLSADKVRAEGFMQQLKVAERKVNALHAKVESLSEDLVEAEKLLKPKTSDTELQRMKDMLRTLSKGVEEMTNAVYECKTELAETAERIKEVKVSLHREKEFRGKLSDLATLVEFVQYLKDSRVQFLSSIWSQILGAASGFLTQATDGTITALAKDESSGFLFCEEGTYAPVTSASGAQRGFIGVAVRLALAQSLRSSCPLIVLDEPTESMGEENARRLSGSLLSHGQVLMITHRATDQYTASNVVEL